MERKFMKHKKLWIGALAIAAAGGLLAGVDSIIFELDGNAVQNNTANDWQNVNANGGTSIAHTGVAYDPSSFSGGTTVTDPTTFVQGSKDTNDISGWKWAAGSIPPKDDIVNAYGAAYNIAGDLVITFGADRFANKWLGSTRVLVLPRGRCASGKRQRKFYWRTCCW
jgi:hypothetical protein